MLVAVPSPSLVTHRTWKVADTSAATDALPPTRVTPVAAVTVVIEEAAVEMTVKENVDPTTGSPPRAAAMLAEMGKLKTQVAPDALVKSPPTNWAPVAVVGEVMAVGTAVCFNMIPVAWICSAATLPLAFMLTAETMLGRYFFWVPPLTDPRMVARWFAVDDIVFRLLLYMQDIYFQNDLPVRKKTKILYCLK